MSLIGRSSIGRPLASLAPLLALLGLTLLPATPAAASGATASSVPGMPSPCWATHYGEGIPPGSYTASGEIFDPNALTAATSLSLSPQLPFGSMVTVTNTANGASVTVRINDRGTFAASPSQPFCIDLTDGAFSRIGAISPDPGHFVVNVDPA
ncbi:septal ring lytic transglycosylase RlpA family protein [Streptomyces sp. 8L]|uniref:septal ring lytic transglycosylase RlpA family protein n=1 Tax=Streptomyces sp. 8L TaxID=2877242 RepID=UPI001CD2BF3B|nr:septal ring lytic transglycosylase RlpA family protein [Streptomyces sp. 8L]MCA1221542.1 septal ring lytic transglycosylase RlpA family protein [Streptomyces sp. 8L]